MRYRDIPLRPRAHYAVNVEWDYLERQIERSEAILEPDFQRGHVWNDAQRIAYLEHVLTGGETAKEITFNCPNHMGQGERGAYELVDGLQRVTAVRAFIANELPAFGHYCREFTDRMRSHCEFIWRVMELPTRADVLRTYIAFNAGGVVHSPDEIARVKALLEKETK